MKEHNCSSCKNSFASSQSLWNHKQRCNRMKFKRKTGGGTTSNETLQNILQSSHDEPTVEEKKVGNHANSKEVKSKENVTISA